MMEASALPAIFEPTITMGAIIVFFSNILTLGAAAISVFYGLKFGQKATEKELKILTHELTEVKLDLKELNKTVSYHAVQDEKILANQQALAAFRGEYQERHKSVNERISRLEEMVFLPPRA